MSTNDKTTTEHSVDSNTLLATWVKELKAYAESKGYDCLIISDGDYADYFNEGLSVGEAFDEELDAAIQCC